MLDSWDLYFKNVSVISNSTQLSNNSSCWVNVIGEIKTNDVGEIDSTTSDATLRKIHLAVVLVTSLFLSVLVTLLFLCSCFNNETFVNVVLRRRIELPKKGIEGQFQFLMPPQSKDTYSTRENTGNHKSPDYDCAKLPKIDVIVEVDSESNADSHLDDVIDSSAPACTTCSDDFTSVTSPFSEFEVNFTEGESSCKSISSLLEKADPITCSFENFYLSEETEC